METVVEMVIGKDSRNENGNRKECSGLSEIEAYRRRKLLAHISVWLRPTASHSGIFERSYRVREEAVAPIVACNVTTTDNY